MERPARSIWPVLLFLLGFIILVTVLSHYFLIPALLATKDATAAEKQRISAYATLLLAIVLVIISIGLFLVLRVKRFFVATPPDKRAKTQYVDAWAEAGKRVQVSDDEDESDDEPPEEQPQR